MSSVLTRMRTALSRQRAVKTNNYSMKGAIGKAEHERQVTRLANEYAAELHHMSVMARSAIFEQPDPPIETLKPTPAEILRGYEELDAIFSEPKQTPHEVLHGVRETDAIFPNGQPQPQDWMIKPSPSDVMHIGRPHQGQTPHSGRYEFGSGAHPYQHEEWFRGFGKDAGDYYKQYKGKFNDCIKGLKAQGYKKKEIADMLGITVKELDARVSLSHQQFMQYQMAEACRIKNADPSLPNTEIAKILGCSEGTVRNFFREGEDYLKRSNAVMGLVDDLKAKVDEFGYIDVSEGNEINIGVSQSRLQTAASILKEQGYTLETIGVPQTYNPDQKTTTLVLAKPGETKASIYKNMEKIKPAFDVDLDENPDYIIGMEYKPANLDSSRIHVVYDEEGGSLRDGLVLLKRGVEDLNLGDSNYAQVRIAVDGTHYIKGMAAYGKDSQFPDGKDIIVFSNKHLGTPLTADDPDAKTVLKPMNRLEDGSIDQKNPFGAAIKINGQSFMTDGDGNYILDANGNKQLRVINKVNEEGDWAKWSKTIASQMLSKQPVEVAKEQLDLAIAKRQQEFDDIMAVTNPIIRNKLLNDYADACDKAAVDLKAAGFDRQQTHAILPLPNMAEDQIYAPNYRDGEHVILIRFPHESVSTIPYLTVNNGHNEEGDSMIGKNAIDAVGIHPRVATQLSGADYDGDTVLVIPADGHNFNYKKAIPDLIEFDGVKKEMYKAYDGMPKMTKKQRGMEMGKVTNLIMDMTQQGAPTDDVVRAIKHSQVVIDAYKHHLDYKKSYVDNGIAELEKIYQPKPGGRHGGASTLITRAKSPVNGLPDRKEGGWITDPKTGERKYAFVDPTTGQKVYSETGRVKHYKAYTDKNGVYHPERDVPITRKSNKMSEATTPEQVRALMSHNGVGNPMERAYADYAITCKNMGNKARLATLSTDTKGYKVDPVAAAKYKPEVDSISRKIDYATSQAPRQRMAQRTANYLIDQSVKRNPEAYKGDEDAMKKLRNSCTQTARRMCKVDSTRLNLTDREWEAVNSNACTRTMLGEILVRSDSRALNSRVMPSKPRDSVSPGLQSMIRSMAGAGNSNADIADRFNLSPSTVANIVKEG